MLFIVVELSLCVCNDEVELKGKGCNRQTVVTNQLLVVANRALQLFNILTCTHVCACV